MIIKTINLCELMFTPRELFKRFIVNLQISKVLKNIFDGKYHSFTETIVGLQLYLKKTLVQVFSCEFCEISTSFFLQNTSGRLLLLLILLYEELLGLLSSFKFNASCFTKFDL